MEALGLGRNNWPSQSNLANLIQIDPDWLANMFFFWLILGCQIVLNLALISQSGVGANLAIPWVDLEVQISPSFN